MVMVRVKGKFGSQLKNF